MELLVEISLVLRQFVSTSVLTVRGARCHTPTDVVGYDIIVSTEYQVRVRIYRCVVSNTEQYCTRARNSWRGLRATQPTALQVEAVGVNLLFAAADARVQFVTVYKVLL